MRWRIRYQLLLPLLILLIGVIGVSVWGAIDAAARVRREIEARVRDVARTLSESPQFPLVANVLEQMKKLSGADYIVTGEHGHATTLASGPRELPPAEAVVDDWQTLRLGPRVLIAGEAYLGSGVRLRPPREGDTLYILYPEKLWRDALWEALWPVLVLGGAVGLASMALAVALAQRFSRRISELERRTRLIAAGDFSPMPIPSRDDEVRDLAQSINDMAEQLARYQETMRRSERLRLLGQVGGGLAHQLRNGLTGARLTVQVFLQEQAGQADVGPLEVALRQLTLLETHLKRFLDLGRQEDPRRERVQLATLVSDAVELLGPGCTHAGINLRWTPPRQQTVVLGDSGQLGQLILNVISNAVEAVGPGGTVEIGLRTSERSAQLAGRTPGSASANGRATTHILEVRDTGKGPPPQVAERLFEPFVTSKPEGVGLGLAVARQIAEAHGGDVTWRREAERTCFAIELPGA